MALVLPHLILVTQGGFIQGRSIMENILICQDLVKLYGRKTASSRCLFKIDLQKAYDSVEWSFLFQMLQELNFPSSFTNLIKECVTTATYTLNLNGDSFGWFKGQKGLRQGDPLSPLLFTICMEYLTRLLAYTTSTMNFKFHPLCRPIKLSSLMFADDMLLFSKGDA
ncbi:secreted RxLR effector protein 78-like [Silene latifolia]|uniref:secreted RxLR effector protein 78-like n=1 Tax=Silene latifolia TaxID=37657 RepID=UPI003D7719C5